MHLFYTPDITDIAYTLNEQESKHCIKVLRLDEGDKINLIDGIGNFYLAEITHPHQKKCKIKVIEKTENYSKRNYNLTIAIAPTKSNDRLEWFCEKATEIGIDKIIPFTSFNSERRNIKIERFEKTIVSAIKQSYKAFKPEFTELTKFNTLIKQKFKGKKFIAHCNNAVNKFHLLNEVYQKNESAIILIGPEGDFTTEEVQLAIDNGFIEINLGDYRLRTETAGLVSVMTISLLNQ